ncbi:HEAT repeat domain-containing protein [Herbaspirillum sp. ST 5-3]|uniref:HEAT repeat domain-containing protein n=1 Tax=Oxalobacteraceae TaxID=75682 RepID=UPI0010A2CAFE|nr:HEAT repeat domain-containing protein [Herbaspirillum sp. ST 5-3]
MPTENEIRVLKILSAIEIPPNAGQTIQSWGNEAVTVVCEAALGTYPGLRPKVRNNAVALLGWMDHQQALETVPLLLNDANTDVSIRAMRAAGRQKNDAGVDKLGQLLRRRDAPPLLAAEAVSALLAIGSDKALASVAAYKSANPADLPHRASKVVESVLSTDGKR